MGTDRVSEQEVLSRPALPAHRTEGYGARPAEGAARPGGSSRTGDRGGSSRTGDRGGDPRFGDLRLPAGPGRRPVAVLLHGGCWRDIADRRYMESLAVALTGAGWATWNVGYRTVDHAGGGYPGTFQDVAAALDHLRELADDHPLDLGRVVTVGHSAGGHLALWAAARPRLIGAPELGSPDPLPVRGVVALAPIADLTAFDALVGRGCGNAVRRLVGSSSSRVDLACPSRLLPLGVPQLLVVGEADPDVPPGHVRGYAASARRAGDPVAVVVVPGAGHFEPVAPWWTRWGALGERILGFMEGV